VPLHELFVDETQDLTQAEIYLLLLLLDDPRGAFFCGDTAQTIAAGVAFRFEDVRTLFRDAQAAVEAAAAAAGRKPPPKLDVPPLRVLQDNYRSSAGILDLAAGALCALTKLFPNSSERREARRALSRRRRAARCAAARARAALRPRLPRPPARRPRFSQSTARTATTACSSARAGSRSRCCCSAPTPPRWPRR
jgi:superfamily I DNA/RNA helicase